MPHLFYTHLSAVSTKFWSKAASQINLWPAKHPAYKQLKWDPCTAAFTPSNKSVSYGRSNSS